MKKGLYKRQIWSKLRKVTPGRPLDPTKISKVIGCTLIHVTSILKSSRDAGFLSINNLGNYVVVHLPSDYEEFDQQTRIKARSYRSAIKNKGVHKLKGPGTEIIPQKIEVTKENILTIMAKIIEEKEDLERKYNNLMIYAKKLKKKLASGVRK